MSKISWNYIKRWFILKNNDQTNNELNYKQAYYYLLNQITDVIKNLMIIQRKASEICIDETPVDDTEPNFDEVLKKIIGELKRRD